MQPAVLRTPDPRQNIAVDGQCQRQAQTVYRQAVDFVSTCIREEADDRCDSTSGMRRS